MTNEENSLSEFLRLIDESPMPRYEDRDEVVIEAFQGLSKEQRICVIKALAQMTIVAL